MQCQEYKYFLVQYVPFVTEQTRINIGVGLLGPGYVGVRFRPTWTKVLNFDPEADIEVLAAMEQELRSLLSESPETTVETLQTLSNGLHISPLVTVLSSDPETTLADLVTKNL